MHRMTLYINSGICKCGHGWQEHHLGMIVNADAFKALPQGYPPYVPQECEHFGHNEDGGYDADGNDHCHGYEDKDGPLATVEW